MFYWWIVLLNVLTLVTARSLDLFARHTMRSHNIMKLKPMKSPSVPPQSATREGKEAASSSASTWTSLLPNKIRRLVRLEECSSMIGLSNS